MSSDPTVQLVEKILGALLDVVGVDTVYAWLFANTDKARAQALLDAEYKAAEAQAAALEKAKFGGP